MSRAIVQSIPISKGEAWRAYERAFHDFSERVRELQGLAANPYPDRAAIEKALLEAERARVIYDQCRDALAQALLPPARRAKLPSQDSPEAVTQRVRSIAELLWETAGRPEGTADADWRLAEQIVKRAATA